MRFFLSTNNQSFTLTSGKLGLNKIKGGENTGCCCACAYEGDGGSSSADNGQANLNGGLVSPQCPDWRK